MRYSKEELDRLMEREAKKHDSGKTAHDDDNPKGVCRDCRWWVCTRPRTIRRGKIESKAMGHCDNPEIPMCMCMKGEDRLCNHCEGPAAVTSIPENIIKDGPPILMPWQRGYKEWAEKNPDLVKRPDSVIICIKDNNIKPIVHTDFDDPQISYVFVDEGYTWDGPPPLNQDDGPLIRGGQD